MPFDISSKKSIVLLIIIRLDSIVLPNSGLLFLLFELQLNLLIILLILDKFFPIKKYSIPFFE